MLIKRLLSAAAAAVMFVQPIGEPSEPFPESDAECAIVVEMQTMTVLYEKSADEQRPMGHMAKLMTVLAAAECLENGSISLDDVAITSANANSEQGTQIWLEVGDKITVEELLKSIIIGNANDACVCLAEHISGSEEKHIELLNSMASRLGMTSTHFADCTGMDENTTSTARDIAALCSNLVKYKNLTDYFITWMENLSCKDVQLVNNNRLVRSHKGLTGFKVCASEKNGVGAAIAASKGNMSICTILLGCKDIESSISYASKILDSTFANFCIFRPEIKKEIPKKIKVINGRKPKVGIRPDDSRGVVTASGFAAGSEPIVELPEDIPAPVRKGQKLGTLTYKSGDTTLLTIELIAAETVERTDLAFAVRRSLLNLLSFGR
ncbi:D-alanyl-D-alanine carboxypeptidase (penicillin-binding protein 5/6) [Ruminococcus sp. YE71]|uniref:D-alanyl-D-alanine carboxypeptidase family protein n=1 Tax=unclassified Ruminococcus TaxID=2608920 RepID=UPI00088675B6|nr:MULTISPECIES: serine hydrolase [unclassified Ruminococcus]SDA20868.1 D-alanyl-D-alanine carboxypeptidase (penicillin-binding protein 5/6) [Ruminococcus sp. YE78]SFW33475.1 D-alanyl-D-alanine carboxypeptidase (penicillin-binding protein 5/6) [Ruminococcus sp. YE71]